MMHKSSRFGFIGDKIRDLTGRLRNALRAEGSQPPKERLGQPANPTERKVSLFERYLHLNAARYFNKRVHYAHSIERLNRLARKHRARLKSKLLKDSRPSELALARIKAMVASRQGRAILRCSSPKKLQRKWGLIPAI